MTRVYLDHAATTPIRPAARAAMAAAWDRWANPSSPHAEGRAARAALEGARARIAAAYGWTGALIFTGGASEALTLALAGAKPARRIVGASEHDAVLRASPSAEIVPVDARGLPVAERLEAALRGGPVVAAFQWANSETGVRQPTRALAEAVHGAGGLLLIDAAQMPPGANPHMADHADFVALSAHKHGGPPGIGALLVRDLATLAPTGGQEQGYRGGTENVPAALAWAAALDEPIDAARIAGLRALLDARIVAAGGEIVAGGQRRHPAIAAYRMPGVAASAQLIRFDLAGFAVSAGSACSSGSLRPSHVLAAMGWREAAAREVIRVSFGWTTTEADVTAFAEAWAAMAHGAAARAA